MAGKTAVRYRDIGKGDKTIVLLHGYMESLEVWDDFAKDLSKDYRIICMDIPGHGISEVMGEVHTMDFLADTLAALLVKIEAAKVNVVGHSMGGYIALAFAKKYEDMCESIVLFHSTPNSDTPDRVEARKREIEIIKSGRKELLTTTNPGKAFAPHNRKKFISYIDELSEQAMLTEEEGIIALLNGMAEREDMNDFLKNSSLKQLFIFGFHDEFMPKEYSESIEANHPQAKVVWLENSGHNGFIEQRSDSITAFKEFIG